jgi:hypothetical protein
VSFDHRDARPAVLGERLEVPATRERDRNERVAGRVELPGANAARPEGPVPLVLAERVAENGASFDVLEDELIACRLQGL